MIEDAKTLQNNTLIDADILIIGAGAAGISLATNFLDKPVKVVILESGGLTYESATQALCRGENVGLRYEPLDLCRVRIFGGSTDRRGWAGWCKTFSQFDLEKRDWVQHSGWPIGKADLDPYYEKALASVMLPPNLERLGRADANAGDCLPLGGDCVNDPVALSTAPHLSETFLERIEASANVQVILHANVTQIETDSDGRIAKAVRFATLDGCRHRVSARFTVIASGGIENARLMLLSNQTVASGLGNASGWVGRCFMDHPRYAWGQINSVRNPAILQRYNPTHGVGQRRYGVPPPGAAPLFGAGIALSEAAQKRERTLASRTWILPVAPQGERDGGRELREVVLWATRRRIPSDIVLRGKKIIGDVPNAAAAAIAHLRSIAGRSNHWQFLTILEPEPNPDSRVMLDDRTDALGLPRVKLDWRLTSLAQHTLSVTQQLIVDSLRKTGLNCFVEGSGGPLANQKFDTPRWVWHHMGTTRMSENPSEGVVDADCRVHGMQNLYVAGSSVFPTCANDMPTLTLMALAHRLADHLQAQLQETCVTAPAAVLLAAADGGEETMSHA
jgi:choline dehydrogenase-like flavoprotein